MLKRMLRDAWHAGLVALPPSASVTVQFLRAHRTFPNLRQPRTLNEKIQFRKLFVTDPRFSLYADKVKVKEVVADLLGPEYVIPTLWHGKRLPLVGERTWPVPFVMKSNHASGWNSFVRNESEKDWRKLEADFDRYISTPWNPWANEPWYNDIERQVLIEPIIGDPVAGLNDYKFFTFDGKVKSIQVDLDRFTDHTRNYFDADWNLQEFGVLLRRTNAVVPKPRYLREMVAAVEKLGASFDFARIDFYELDSGPKFGEMTFSPGSGMEPFTPSRYDRVLGDFWRMPGER